MYLHSITFSSSFFNLRSSVDKIFSNSKLCTTSSYDSVHHHMIIISASSNFSLLEISLHLTQPTLFLLASLQISHQSSQQLLTTFYEHYHGNPNSNSWMKGLIMSCSSQPHYFPRLGKGRAQPVKALDFRKGLLIGKQLHLGGIFGDLSYFHYKRSTQSPKTHLSDQSIDLSRP